MPEINALVGWQTRHAEKTGELEHTVTETTPGETERKNPKE